MKLINISYIVAAMLGASALSGCGVYGKYSPDKVNNATVNEYAEAIKQTPDPASLGNLSWQEVFTDPMLADLINRALLNNKDLRNAKLNIDMAHAQLLGARLSYLPSVALAPTASRSSNGLTHTWSEWTYSLPLAVNWEVDIFGKLLNTKRGAQASLEQAQAYEQAVRSQIIAGVAQSYYTIVALKSQLQLSR